MPHGGHHGSDGVAQPLNLIAAALFDFHSRKAPVQLPYGALQAADRVRDAGGDQKVQEGNQEDGKQQQCQTEEEGLEGRVRPASGGDHAYQLPSGVAHGFDGNLPGLAPELFLVAAVPVGSGFPVIFC